MFKSYPSIEKPKEKYLDGVFLSTDSKDLFCASEKVHGSNFSFIVCRDEKSSIQVEVAKRSGLIQKGDSAKFFPNAVKTVRSKYDNCAKNLFEFIEKELETNELFSQNREHLDTLIAKVEGVEKINIYGELFGGQYPHKKLDVSERSSGKPIQIGVYYTNVFEFYAFDVFVKLKMSEGKANCFWLSPSQYEYIFPQCGFDIYAKSLKIAPLKELINMDIHWNTKIPEMFFSHLPTAAEKGSSIEKNISEGVVVKPYEKHLCYDGDRIVVKLKNPEFSEINPSKIKKLHTKPPEVTKELREVLDKLSEYFTENRIHTVESKIGDVKDSKNKKMQGMLIGLYGKDALEDFIEDSKSNENGMNVDIWANLPEAEQKRAKKFVSKKAAETIMKYLKS